MIALRRCTFVAQMHRGVVLRAANQNYTIAGGNRTLIQVGAAPYNLIDKRELVKISKKGQQKPPADLKACRRLRELFYSFFRFFCFFVSFIRENYPVDIEVLPIVALEGHKQKQSHRNHAA